ncbi:MAG: glutamate formimidoyltransferase [Thermoplasmatales archaeon]|nr:MAG: glutamate formimidoyltransferase [Thermoplasmatales archaeon]
MDKIVECVPNFSEGKDKTVINAISAAIESVNCVKLLDVDPGEDFNRTVFTFVGEPEPILEAAFRAAKIGIALIDMSKHKGEHARMGALDVCPFIPIKGVNDKDCIEISKKFGQRIAKELNVPVFLYAKSATKKERIRLPDIRKGEYEALEEKFKDPSYKPDFGKPVFVPKSGATATGCRDILLAYNINLDSNDKSLASKIAGKIRTSGVLKKDKDGNKIIGSDGKPERIPGKFKGVQAGGMMYNEDISQVSMNLLNFREVNINHVYEEVKKEAAKLGIKATGSEIVGLVPKESLILAGKYYSEKEKTNIIDELELVNLAVEKLGLSDLYLFKPEQKVIEYMVEETGQLVSMKVGGFLSELASNSPAPGGGSVAALAGGLGAGLSSMVCNLTIGKEKYADVEKDIKKTLIQSEKIRKKLTFLIDKDTEAFNDVIKAFQMPKETEQQKTKRSAAIQNGYKTAAMVPLETAMTCAEVLDVALVVAQKGNVNSITDAAVSAIMAKAGVEGAILNIRINLGSIKDEKFVKEMSTDLEKLLKCTSKKTEEILKIVNSKM